MMTRWFESLRGGRVPGSAMVYSLQPLPSGLKCSQLHEVEVVKLLSAHAFHRFTIKGGESEELL
jgi:hypothetical protein